MSWRNRLRAPGNELLSRKRYGKVGKPWCVPINQWNYNLDGKLIGVPFPTWSCKGAGGHAGRFHPG